MRKNIKLRYNGVEKDFLLELFAKNLQHQSSIDNLGRSILNPLEKVDKDYFTYEQIVLLNYELSITERESLENAQIKYQALYEKIYYADKHYGFSDVSEPQHLYRVYKKRLTHISEIEHLTLIPFFENLISILERGESNPVEIKEKDFLNINFSDILQFGQNLDDGEFGLFITKYNPKHSIQRRFCSYEKLVSTSETDTDYCTYLIKMLPKNYQDYYGNQIDLKSVEELRKSVYNKRNNTKKYSRYGLFENIDIVDYKREYQNHLKLHKPAFLEGAYSDIKKVFDSQEYLLNAVRRTINQEYEDMKKFKLERDYDTRNGVNWENWNDDLDADQQSADFWNQF